MPQYDQVKWEKAECRDHAYTDLFYTVEEQRSILQYEFINALRSICARCPIWADCLKYALENETYGVWGGMTSVERTALLDRDRYPNQRARAITELSRYGISYQQIMECVKGDKMHPGQCEGCKRSALLIGGVYCETCEDRSERE